MASESDDAKPGAAPEDPISKSEKRKSDQDSDRSDQTADLAHSNFGSSPLASGRYVDPQFMRAAMFPFSIALISVISILVLIYIQSFWTVNISHDNGSLFENLVYLYGLHMIFGCIAIFSTYIAFRLISIAGATATVVIPPQDYQLLAPLVSEGKSEAIDQYVRLSSLAKFTGTFTQLGLSGLPLATIALTIFFALLSIVKPDSFLDLTKLTLGAFIGSFVQRQVEQKKASIEEEGRVQKVDATVDSI